MITGIFIQKSFFRRGVSMNKFQAGLQEVMYGIIAGIVFSAIMKALVDDGLIPPIFVLLFILAGIAGNIATIKKFQFAATVYTIGWLIGGLLLREVLGPIDFIMYIAVPIGILGLRVWQFIRSIV